MGSTFSMDRYLVRWASQGCGPILGKMGLPGLWSVWWSLWSFWAGRPLYPLGLPCLALLFLGLALPCLLPLPSIIAQSAFAKNRTRQQKGLRDRNSPTCTLSQNGYGTNCSQTSELRPTIGAQLSSHNDHSGHNNHSNHND